MKRYAGFIALGLLSLGALWFARENPAPTEPAGNRQTQSQSQTAGNSRLDAPGRDVSRQETGKNPAPRGNGFDFYVLSLSWSPAFCASSEGSGNRQQCGSDRRYGFVVHGLWPQNENGYPEFCQSGEPDRVPDAIGRTMFDIMPSMGLIGHQWRKHGSCSGLSQRDYFSATRAAFEAIRLPGKIASGAEAATLSADAIETAFTDANPGLSKRGISISCDGRRLEEVRICLNRDMTFRDCPELDRKGCRANATEIIPIR
ncbi:MULTISPECIES: ribonuclease T2 family protein [Rhizobium/Agrobacterium group]|uniref:ribonuclease T2 family protein n=1 Tax=Rhizobium/Agrobacterium group TaxID=227290 RepID=UPI000FD6C19B|nr:MULTISPECIES: ribonuclease [Rhizobium/Agrobacterium group]UXS38969.1 ribonuclease [Agrobacterium tumefaciens]MBB4400077.1 ribonuclease T2 [Agrobacterium radiobacter]MBB5586232.1 ribonuclease T2 [Agrobacterium radiobacter]RVT73240.1 ribonuclease [Agrobacterium sp. CNPSo 2736]TGE91999.1 ribonuclease [Rhizobium sp. SEMIA 4032]